MWKQRKSGTEKQQFLHLWNDKAIKICYVSKTTLQQCNDKGFLRNKHPGHQELLQEVHFKRVNLKKRKKNKKHMERPNKRQTA